MICPKCKNVGVLANAGIVTNIPYWYCRTCKEEIQLEEVPFEFKLELNKNNSEDLDLLKEFERLINEGNKPPEDML